VDVEVDQHAASAERLPDEAGNTTSIDREVAPSTPEFDGMVLAGGAGCSVAPTGNDMSPWLLLLGVFGWRIRRRR